MDLKKLGTIIRNKREELGISPSVLAEKVGIRRPTLWIIERGENPKTGKPSRPSKDKLERLAEVLRMNQAETEELLSLADYTYTKQSTELKDSLRQFSLSPNASLAIVDGTIYVAKDGYLHAIDTKTGKRLWSSSLDVSPLASERAQEERDKQSPLPQQDQRHQIAKKRQGLLFVLSGISGSENTDVIDGLKKGGIDIFVSPIYLTRHPHFMESPDNYRIFISDKLFQVLRNEGDLLTFFYNDKRPEKPSAWYGHEREPIIQNLHMGKDVIMDAGPEEAAQVRESIPNSILIHLKLQRDAGIEKEHKLWKERLQRINDDCQIKYNYTVYFEYGHLHRAVDELSSIIWRERVKAQEDSIVSEQLESQTSNEDTDWDVTTG